MAGVTQSSVGVSVSVKIPPDWLHEPRFPNRSDLLEARRLERRQLALSAAQREPTLGGGNEGRSRFARSETIFRDSFRKSGAFDLSGQPPLSPTHFHARATCSGLVTRTACLNQRHEQRRVESLAFEPHEIMRLRDIPKAEQLREWWKQPREGYEVDPAATVCANSLRLDLARRGLELGPMDPGKVRSPASVDERRRLKQQKALLANSVHRITHSIPAAYLKGNRADTATIAWAPDLYAQERPESGREGGGAGGGGTSGITHGALTRAGSLPPAFPLVSPVKDPDARQPCRRPDRPTRLSIESLFLESTSQRAQLDQIKACSPLASPGHQVLGGNGTEGGRGWASALPTDSQFTSSPNQSVGGDARHGAVRCGGFA